LRWSSSANSSLVRRWWEYRTHSSLLVGIHSTLKSLRIHIPARDEVLEILSNCSNKGRLFEFRARESQHSRRHFQTGQHTDCTTKTKTTIHLSVSRMYYRTSRPQRASIRNISQTRKPSSWYTHSYRILHGRNHRVQRQGHLGINSESTRGMPIVVSWICGTVYLRVLSNTSNWVF
jgi:hypothetical protein